eukprot:SAG22_NODE_48_length_24654_cov_4.406394_20_plen_85_part_00
MFHGNHNSNITRHVNLTCRPRPVRTKVDVRAQRLISHRAWFPSVLSGRIRLVPRHVRHQVLHRQQRDDKTKGGTISNLGSSHRV